MPGTGEGDRVPALLEPGELVVPKKFVGGEMGGATINVNMEGAFIMDDPVVVDKLYREYLKDAIERDSRRSS